MLNLNMTESGQCKCCLNNCDLRDLWSEYLSSESGETEIYGDMLVDCYLLSWQPPGDDERDYICESCVQRLRIAYNFKKEILHSESLLNEVKNITCYYDEKIKREFEDHEMNNEEVLVEYLEESGGEENGDDDSGDEIYLEVKSEDAEEDFEEVEYLDDELPVDDDYAETNKLQMNKSTRSSKKKKNKKIKNDSSPKTYSDKDLEIAVKAIKAKEMTLATASEQYNIPISKIRLKMNNTRTKDGNQSENDLVTEETAIKDKKKAQNIPKIRSEIEKHRDNIRSVLTYSNATPIRRYLGIGYHCSYCEKQFPDPSQLKSHSLNEHTSQCKAKFFQKKVDLYKVDVTNLKCTLCNEDIPSLELLMDHLRLEHEKPIHFDVLHNILPFKFDTDVLKCVVCHEQYSSFKVLLEHLQSHYTNYVCPICGKGFVNKSTLNGHKTRHRMGEFKCSLCTKIFNSYTKKRDHERVVHINLNRIYKCGYCDEKFSQAERKLEHEIKVHGSKPRTYVCKACNKTYETQRALRIHTYTFHLVHTPHKCGICPKQYYKKSHLQMHMKKHNRIPVECDVCFRTFYSQKVMENHRKKVHCKQLIGCLYCERKFSDEYHLKKHVEFRHDFTSMQDEGDDVSLN